MLAVFLFDAHFLPMRLAIVSTRALCFVHGIESVCFFLHFVIFSRKILRVFFLGCLNEDG